MPEVAMYSLKLGEGGQIAGYEVFRIKVDKPCMAFGKMQPEKEHFPGNEEFGSFAWSWLTLEQAEQCFSKLCRGKPSKTYARSTGSLPVSRIGNFLTKGTSEDTCLYVGHKNR